MYDHRSCIYVIENVVNGKRYVGQTTDFRRRQLAHLSALRNKRSHNKHLQNAFDKYGEECFRFYVLEYCNADSLDEREVYWIARLRTHTDGYNMDKGGRGIRGYHFTPEQCEKISKKLTGRKVSDETRQKLRENHADFKGEKSPSYGIPWEERVSEEKQEKIRKACSERYSGKGNPNYGKLMSQEQKNKLSESQKRRYLLNGNPLRGRKRPDLAGANSAHAHGVVRVNDGFMYQTVVDAASDNGISQSNVSLCCLGRLTHAGCMPGNNEWAIFRYKEDYDKMSDSEIENCLSFARAKKSNHKSIPVVCITTGEVFGSMKEAAMRYNLDPSELTKCCKGRKQFCGKDPNTNTRLSWQYIS